MLPHWYTHGVTCNLVLTKDAGYTMVRTIRNRVVPFMKNFALFISSLWEAKEEGKQENEERDLIA